jgi:hypothetical protein
VAIGKPKALNTYAQEPLNIGMNDEPIDIVDRILTEDIELLKKWIKEIESKIQSRTQLTKDLMRQLGEDIQMLERRDETLEIWGPGYKQSIDRARSELRSQINILKNEARNQEVSFWRDVTSLEKEFRILLQAYSRAKRKKDLNDS